MVPPSNSDGSGSVAPEAAKVRAISDGKVITTPSGQKFDLSGVRPPRSKEQVAADAATPSVAKTYPMTPPNPSWRDLNDLEAWVYSTIPHEHDSRNLGQLINNARGARQGGDQDEYVKAVLDLLTYHQDAFKADEAYTNYKFTDTSFLTPKNGALLTARFRGKTRTGKDPVTTAKYFSNSISEFKAARPDLADFVSAMPGRWNISGAIAESDERKAEITKDLRTLGYSDVDIAHIAMAEVAREFNLRATNPELAHVKIHSPALGHSITIGVDPSGKGPDGRFKPVVSKEEFFSVSQGIDNLGKFGFYQEKVDVVLAHSGTNVGSRGDVDGGEAAGYTYDNDSNTAIVVIPDRVRKSVERIQAGAENFWSTNVIDVDSAYKHIIAHETGHRVKVAKWGSDDKGENSLLADVKHFTSMIAAAPATPAATSEPPKVDDSKVNADSLKKIAPVDLSGWTKIGNALGSNAGGTYQDPATGRKIYMKFPESAGHAGNEVLASTIYNFLGVSSSQTKPGLFNGKRVVYSEWQDGSKQDLTSKLGDSKYLEKIQDGFATDALLANWDVAGSGYNNIVTDKNGDPIRIDPGGALLYRAQGSPKGAAFTDDVSELESLVDRGFNASGYDVFGSMSEAAKAKSAQKLLNLTDDAIDQMVGNSVTGPDADVLKDKLRKRRDYILKRYNVTAQPKPDVAPQVAPDDVSAPLLKDAGLDVPVSKYGESDPMENFAEIFAKYVIDGEAPEWFIELLKSKGLSKRAINLAWRDALNGNSKSLFESMLKTIEAKNSGTPMVPSQTSRGNSNVGQKDAHIAAFLTGVADKKPNIVDQFPTGALTVWRGLKKYGNDTGEQLRKDWKYDDKPFHTSGIYGNGMYASNLKSRGLSYANNKENAVEEMGIDPNAKILLVDNSGKPSNFKMKNTTSIDSLFPRGIGQIGEQIENIVKNYVQNELHPEYDDNDSRLSAKIRDILNNELDGVFNVSGNYSILAALLGFDGVEVWQSRDESYFVTVNRGILYMKPDK